MVGLDNPLHLIFLLLIVLLVFGAKRLPEMGRSLGTGLRGFKEALSGESHEPHLAETEVTPASALTPALDLTGDEPVSATVEQELETRHAA